MKLLLVLLLLGCHAAAGDFIVLKRDGVFRADQDIALALRAGDCFPLIAWDANRMGATMKFGDSSFYRFWYDLRTVVGSKEAQARYEAAMKRINAEYAVALVEREEKRKLAEDKRLAREQQMAVEAGRRAEVAREMSEQRQMDSIEAALWQIATQRR